MIVWIAGCSASSAPGRRSVCDHLRRGSAALRPVPPLALSLPMRTKATGDGEGEDAEMYPPSTASAHSAAPPLFLVSMPFARHAALSDRLSAFALPHQTERPSRVRSSYLQTGKSHGISVPAVRQVDGASA